MSIKFKIRTAVNKVLRPFGFELHRIGQTPIAPEILPYISTIRQLGGIMKESLFPDLPPRPDRDRLMTELEGTGVSEAFYIVNHLNLCSILDGDVCEFGVAQGATSALLANEIYPGDKKLWLFDTFSGLPKPTEKDVLINDIFGLGSIEKYQGTMAYGQEKVRARLREISFPENRTKIVPGLIEEISKSGPLPEKVCFAYVDFDFYEPIKTALELLDQRMPVGGTIIVDDYGFFSAGAKTAVDEFVALPPQRFSLTLPLQFAGNFCILKKIAE